MESVYRFLVSALLYPPLAFYLFTRPCPLTFRWDIRFRLPTSLDVRLFGNVDLLKLRRTVRYKPRRRLGLHVLRGRPRRLYAEVDIATPPRSSSKSPSDDDGQSPSPRTPCPDVPSGTGPWRSDRTEFDFVDGLKTYNSATMDFNTQAPNPYTPPHTCFEAYYGCTSSEAWSYIETHSVDPLESYLKEKSLLYSDMFRTTREDVVLKRAFIAAKQLLVDSSTQRALHGIFLTDTSKADVHERHLDVPIVVDTGASFSLTPFLSDFTSELELPDVDNLTGLTDKVKVEGIGWVEWYVRDAKGQVALIRTKAYYVPEADIRLMSPQTYFELHDGGKAVLDHQGMTLHTPEDVHLEFPYQFGAIYWKRYPNWWRGICLHVSALTIYPTETLTMTWPWSRT